MRPAGTTPAKSSRGDIAIIYGKRPVQAVVAVARQNSAAVQSTANPKQHWAWFQIQPLPVELPLDALTRHRRIGRWKALGNLQGRPKNVPPEIQADIFQLLAGTESRIANRLRRWLDSSARFPSTRDLPLADLRRAAWDQPPSNGLPDDHERWLSEDIAQRLVRSRFARWFGDDDDLPGFEIEHRLQLADGRFGRADVVLVSRKHVARPLLLVEVKKHAEPVLGRDPVPQILGYRQALHREVPGWRIKPLIIALAFHPAVRRQARAARIDCRRYDSERDRLLDA